MLGQSLESIVDIVAVRIAGAALDTDVDLDLGSMNLIVFGPAVELEFDVGRRNPAVIVLATELDL